MVSVNVCTLAVDWHDLVYVLYMQFQSISCRFDSRGQLRGTEQGFIQNQVRGEIPPSMVLYETLQLVTFQRVMWKERTTVDDP